MKSFFSLSILLGILSSVLIGCGGRPSNFNANGKIGTNSGGAFSPAPSNGQSSGGQPSSAPASSALPTPPRDATVIDQIQSSTEDWGSCSVCAQGTNSTDNFWMASNQSSPSMSGSSRQFYVGGPQWSNALFWKTIYGHSSETNFLWDFYVYWDPTSMANIWTSEFDFWQSVGGKEFMIGNQCNFGDGYWDIWDSKGNVWLHTDFRCDRLEPGQWHHFQIYTQRLGMEQYRYNTMVIDGKVYNINRTFEPNPTDWKDTMGVQWQLDQSNTGVDVHQWVDNVKLTVW